MGKLVKILSRNGDFALTLDADNVVRVHPVTDSTTQLWALHDGSAGNFSLSVPGRPDLYLNYTKADTALSIGVYDKNLSVWNASNPSITTTAIRPITDTSQNINAFGSLKDGANVGTWKWGGGADNEVWTLVPPITIYTKIISANGQFAVAHESDNSVKAEYVMEGPKSQYWTINKLSDTNFTICVPGTGQYLNYSKENANVVLGAYDSKLSVWNASGRGMVHIAIRPSSNTKQNLNAFGSLKSGASIGTWTWGGGSENEVWTLL